jgi:hypothetical protein
LAFIGAARKKTPHAEPKTTIPGYAIEGEPRGKIWRLRVPSLRPDLPILGRHSVLKPSWPEALAEARARIDHVLAA